MNGWGTVTISAGLAVFDIPWEIKPLWGAISDFVPLFGYRRRSYLALASVAGIAAFAWVATLQNPATLIPAMLVTSLAMAICSLPSLKARLAAPIAAFRTRSLWLVAGFLFLYYFSPHFGTLLYFQMTDNLHFSQGLIGALASIGSGGWILGGLLYTWHIKRLSHPALLRLSIVGGVVSTLSYLLLVDPVTAVLIYLFAGLTSMLAFVATRSLAADSSPEGAEGFAFAAMMSILNLTQPLADTFGAVLYEHAFNRHLPGLIIVAAAATGLVFFLVPLMAFRPAGAPRS